MQNTETYGLTHLALAVRDIQRTKTFYQQVFHMEVMYLQEDFLQLTTPECHDILVFEKRDVPFPAVSGNIAHFGFRLRRPEDIDALRERIISAGALITEEGEFVKGSPYIF